MALELLLYFSVHLALQLLPAASLQWGTTHAYAAFLVSPAHPATPATQACPFFSVALPPAVALPLVAAPPQAVAQPPAVERHHAVARPLGVEHPPVVARLLSHLLSLARPPVVARHQSLARTPHVARHQAPPCSLHHLVPRLRPQLLCPWEAALMAHLLPPSPALYWALATAPSATAPPWASAPTCLPCHPATGPARGPVAVAPALRATFASMRPTPMSLCPPAPATPPAPWPSPPLRATRSPAPSIKASQAAAALSSPVQLRRMAQPQMQMQPLQRRLAASLLLPLPLYPSAVPGACWCGPAAAHLALPLPLPP